MPRLTKWGGADPLAYLDLLLRERLKGERKNLSRHERSFAKWQKIRARLKRRSGDAILEVVIEAKMRPHQQGAQEARAWIEGLEIALKLAGGYDYDGGSVEETLGDLLEGLQGQRVHQRKRKAA